MNFSFVSLFKKSKIGFLLSAIALSNTALGWGSLGHQTVAEVGAEITSDSSNFWKSNVPSLGTLSNWPDWSWKKPETKESEAPTHWFHFDFYSPNQKPFPNIFASLYKLLETYSEIEIAENGTAPWRIGQMYEKAKNALVAGEFEGALSWAGVMTHYVGDLSQPLHVTSNYDGEMTNQKGIHSWFETHNLDKLDKKVLKKRILQESKDLFFQMKQTRKSCVSLSAETLAFDEAFESAKWVTPILDLEKKLGRKSKEAVEAAQELAYHRLAFGAANLAVMLDCLGNFVSAEDQNSTVTLVKPNWVPLFEETVVAR